jgi:hypothetical protein
MQFNAAFTNEYNKIYNSMCSISLGASKIIPHYN